MKLFNDSPLELIQLDGLVTYYGQVISQEESHAYYQKLLTNIAWKYDEAKIYGKHFITKRKAAWYGDHAFDYTYSNITKSAQVWTSDLLELKHLVEHLSGTTYNSCLLNLYHNGSEGMAWHSDGEKTLKQRATIASMSFGAERKFSFKHKLNKTKVDITLENGSLLLMQNDTQEHWLHRLPPTKIVMGPRINLTFRTILL